MSASTTKVTDPLPCPRCRSNTTVVRAVSPKAGVWTVYGCDTCFYTWRSTEPEENTNPDKYPAVFRLSRRSFQNSRWRHPFRRFDR